MICLRLRAVATQGRQSTGTASQKRAWGSETCQHRSNERHVLDWLAAMLDLLLKIVSLGGLLSGWAESHRRLLLSLSPEDFELRSVTARA